MWMSSGTVSSSMHVHRKGVKSTSKLIAGPFAFFANVAARCSVPAPFKSCGMRLSVDLDDQLGGDAGEVRDVSGLGCWRLNLYPSKRRLRRAYESVASEAV